MHEGHAEIREAHALWGKTTDESEAILKKHLHEKEVYTACIGPAGENMVRTACIVHGYNVAGRTGMGAVMGSKNLKALVLEGRARAPSAHPEAVKQQSRSVSALIPRGKSQLPAWAVTPLGRLMAGMKTSFRIDGLMSLSPFSEWGTATANELSVVTGDAPVRNWRGRPAMFKAARVGIAQVARTQRKKYHCTAW